MYMSVENHLAVNGIHGLRDVPKGTTYDRAFFCDYLAPDVTRSFCAPRRIATFQGFKIHRNNASPHNSRSRGRLERIRAVRVSRPASRRDLAEMISSSLGI
jgi:hypothetical protein